ncbi:MAG: FAD-dependent oxidoreductase, partial [Deltaproteobacteria bacterium]|nr:FAD-dependent oxidoreductase [Deltaproteobacteria bacterium]
HCISSDGFWELEDQPKRAILIGGGYIALELACALQGLGTETHLLVRSKLLSSFDQDIAEHLEATLIKTGLTIHRPVQINEVSKTETGTAVSFTDSDGNVTRLEADEAALVATGRHPNTENLGLGSAGVELGSRGEIKVSSNDETSCAGIYAVGDVTLRSMLTPVAIKSGRLLADRLYKGTETTMEYDNIPTAVFSQPPVGVVGLSEEAARAKYPDAVKVYRSEFGGLLFSPTPKERTMRCLMKLVVHQDTDKVLGCHMVGPDAAEIIQGFAAAMQAGATKADFDRTIAIHPSSAEEFVLMS